jgi:hypothetical protein
VSRRGGKSTIDARNNGWGCNGGPGSPCNPVSPTPDGVKVVVSPWLVLGVSAASNSVLAGESVQITADLTRTSAAGNPVATGGILPDGTVVQFASTLGTVNPVVTSTTSGTATTMFAAGNVGGTASISARVDQETLLTVVLITGATPVGHRVTIIPDADSRTGSPGDTVNYRLWVVNNGALPDTYSLTYVPTTWMPSGPASVSVAAGNYVEITVAVTIPASAVAGDNNIVTATAASQAEPGVSDSATLTTTVSQSTSYWVSLSPSVASQSGQPGTTVTYTMAVNNDGTTQDTYDASYIGWTWPTSGPSVIGPVAAGDSVDVTLTVQIPTDKLPGDQDHFTFLVISRGDSTNKSASSTLQTSVPLPPGYRTYLPMVVR